MYRSPLASCPRQACLRIPSRTCPQTLTSGLASRLMLTRRPTLLPTRSQLPATSQLSTADSEALLSPIQVSLLRLTSISRQASMVRRNGETLPTTNRSSYRLSPPRSLVPFPPMSLLCALRMLLPPRPASTLRLLRSTKRSALLRDSAPTRRPMSVLRLPLMPHTLLHPSTVGSTTSSMLTLRSSDRSLSKIVIFRMRSLLLRPTKPPRCLPPEGTTGRRSCV